MKHLHDNRELFREAVFAAANELMLPVPIVEKDYYVTALLRELAERKPDCVFKGGTSLSKCYKVIDRFSEDVDIAFKTRLSQKEKRELKDRVIAEISSQLHMPISDWAEAGSRKEYNCYSFCYDSIDNYGEVPITPCVKLETSLITMSFPTVRLPVDNYLFEFLKRDNMDIVKEYHLLPFSMEVQQMERTLIDKVFALCDYYLEGKTEHHSRHIYDIYKILPEIQVNDHFCHLVEKVRRERAAHKSCCSAQPGVYIEKVLEEMVSRRAYEKDYQAVTSFFLNDTVSYDEAISGINRVIESRMFWNGAQPWNGM